GFGKVTSESQASNGDRYRWTGRESDSETGFQLNGFRYYDPLAGHWTSEDPLGLAPDSNQYRYVGNSSTNFIDPSGLAPEEVGALGAVVGASYTPPGQVGAMMISDGGAMHTMTPPTPPPGGWKKPPIWNEPYHPSPDDPKDPFQPLPSRPRKLGPTKGGGIDLPDTGEPDVPEPSEPDVQLAEPPDISVESNGDIFVPEDYSEPEWPTNYAAGRDEAQFQKLPAKPRGTSPPSKTDQYVPGGDDAPVQKMPARPGVGCGVMTEEYRPGSDNGACKPPSTEDFMKMRP